MRHSFVFPFSAVAILGVVGLIYLSLHPEYIGMQTTPIQTIQDDIGENPTSFIDTEEEVGPEIIVNDDRFDEIPVNEQEATDFATSDSLGSDLEEQSPEQAAIADDLPNNVHLDVPFYSQSPDGSWTLPRKEACEEASIILAAYFLKDTDLSLAQFEEDVLALVSLQEEIFGDYVDTSIEQTATLYNTYFGIGETLILDDPTVDDLKYHLAQGHPIVAPFAGKKLGNSYFANGGPRYHMLVIIGYDETYFYTNDVGTSRGANFPYSYDVIMDALHDLVPVGEGDITDGAKRVLVLVK